MFKGVREIEVRSQESGVNPTVKRGLGKLLCI
jgi:hypothetical protein